MSTTRRQFLQASAATGALATTGLFARPARLRQNEPAKRQRILILGGTGFLGPALIDAVVARGHALTLFNSGRTEERRAEAGRPSVIPDGVEVLVGNRDPELTADDRRLAGDPDIEKKRDPKSPHGLSQLEGRDWDAVIDTSGFFPRMVRASAELLAPHVGQYVFVSSISVYARNDEPDMDETAELLTLADPTVEEFGPNFENYGGGKAMCEAAAEAALPGHATNVRPGYIVGPRDTSRRWLWWPWRTAQGGEMLVPGTADDPMQVIDVRDLAEWIVHAIETRAFGAFNATSRPMAMRAMLEGCRAGAGSETSFAWADPSFLAEHELSFPIWIPPEGETAGFHRVSVERAFEAGLRTRSIETTARDTLAWFDELPEDLAPRVLPPIPLEREAEVLALWKAR